MQAVVHHTYHEHRVNLQSSTSVFWRRIDSEYLDLRVRQALQARPILRLLLAEGAGSSL
jgi:hypothetical protein